MEEAGIPEEERNFKMKWELGLDIIRHQTALGASFNFVSGDGYYGNSIEFAEAINAMNYIYMLDIHSNLTVYLEKPEIGIPPAKSKRGRQPSKVQPIGKGIRVDKYMSELPESDWLYLEVRNTAKGVLVGHYHFRTVYIYDEENLRMLRRLLVIRRTLDEKNEYEYKYSFTNANLDQYFDKLNNHIPKTVLLTCRRNAFLLSIVSRKTNRYSGWINIKPGNGWPGNIKSGLPFYCRLFS